MVFPNKERFRLSYSDEVVDLIKKLLNKNRDQRLGAESDAREILAHPWFADIDLRALENLDIPPPFLPGNQGGFNSQYFNTRSNLEDLQETVLNRN